MIAEFDGKLSAELVAGIVRGARKDLGRDVPPEALPEFTHRLARQRLVDWQPEVAEFRRLSSQAIRQSA